MSLVRSVLTVRNRRGAHADKACNERTRKTLRTTRSYHSSSLPVHHIPGRASPSRQQSGRRILPLDLQSLTEQQRNKLIKLLGSRYNPSTSLAKVSCESYDTQAANKRHLGTVVNRLISEAKDATDTFEDVPFDFRHHKEKKRLEFPETWKMTTERKRYLEAKRGAERDRFQQGSMVDGAKLIEEMIAKEKVPEPAMVEQRLGGGRTGQRARLR